MLSEQHPKGAQSLIAGGLMDLPLAIKDSAGSPYRFPSNGSEENLIVLSCPCVTSFCSVLGSVPFSQSKVGGDGPELTTSLWAILGKMWPLSSG